jgi:hypothetical protein
MIKHNSKGGLSPPLFYKIANFLSLINQGVIGS